MTPALKKSGLDTSDLAKYWPVSNLTFISKVVGRAVALQLNEYLLANNLIPRCQPAYRKKHSTETQCFASCLIASRQLMKEKSRCLVLGLLDMSAAFDCVDHDILLWRLRLRYGLVDASSIGSVRF